MRFFESHLERLDAGMRKTSFDTLQRGLQSSANGGKEFLLPIPSTFSPLSYVALSGSGVSRDLFAVSSFLERDKVNSAWDNFEQALCSLCQEDAQCPKPSFTPTMDPSRTVHPDAKVEDFALLVKEGDVSFVEVEMRFLPIGKSLPRPAKVVDRRTDRTTRSESKQ